MGNWNQSSTTDYESEAYGVGTGGSTLGGSAGDFDYSVPTSVGGGGGSSGPTLPSDKELVQQVAPGFDANQYLKNNPDVAQNWAGTPEEHYLAYGQYETGRSWTAPTTTTTSKPPTPKPPTPKPPTPTAPPADVRIDAEGNTYNFNIDRTADYYVDESGRKVYDTLDAQMKELYAASGQFDKLGQFAGENQTSFLTAEGELISWGDQLDKELNLAASVFDAMDKAEELYPDQQTILSEQYGLLVEAPPSLYSFVVEDFGPAFANVTAGKIGGEFAGFLAFDVFGAPVDPYSANIAYQTGKAGGSGALFGKSSFEAELFIDPLTEERVLKQTLNFGDNKSQTIFTTESEFAEKWAEIAALQEKASAQDDYIPNVEAVKEEFTGKKEPDWRDYVNRDFDIGQVFFDSITGGTTLSQLPEQTQDVIVMAMGLAEGKDPLNILIDLYGEDVADELKLEELANNSIDELFSPEVAEWIKSNHDLAKLGADVVVRGKDLSASIRDRYGDDLLTALGAETKTGRAAGIAGLDFVVDLDQGMDPAQAAGEALYTFFDNGGKLSDLVSGEGLSFNLPDVDLPAFNITNPFKGLFPDINVDLPDGIDISGLDLKGIWDNLKAKMPDIPDFTFTSDLLKFGFEVPQLFEMGFEMEDFDWPTVNVGDLSLGDFTKFNISLPDIEGFGINLRDLNIDIPKLEFQLALLGERIPGEKVSGEDIIQSLEPDLDFLGEDELTFSRQVLERTV